MHKLPRKPAEASSAHGQAVNTNTANNNRGRGGGNSNNNNKRGNSNNRGGTINSNNNRSNSNSSRGNSSSRGKSNNNNSSNDNNSNRGKTKNRRRGGNGNRSGSNRGAYNNKNNNNNRDGNNDESEESSTYSTDDQNDQLSGNMGSEDCRAIDYLPEDFFDHDEQGQRYIWHGPAPVCSSRTAYQFSPFNLDHSFEIWQTPERFDMLWPPPLRIRCQPFNLYRMTQAFKAVELDIKQWEDLLEDLWQHVLSDDSGNLIAILWVITRLQYLRALYPVMDANKYDFDMKSYYNYAVRMMNFKGPDCRVVVDFMSWKKEATQEDIFMYLDKCFEDHTFFRDLAKRLNTSAQKSATKHNIEPPQDTLAHKKAKIDTTSAVVPPPYIPKETQGAATTPTTEQTSVVVNTPSLNPVTPEIVATPSSKPGPESKGFANSPSSSPNSPQAHATSQTIASNSQSQPTATSWTTGTPPTSSVLSFTSLPTTTTTTPNCGGGELFPTPTNPPVSSTFVATLPPACHVAQPQPAAAPPTPEVTIKPISQHTPPLTPTTTRSVPPPKLTHQLPPKPQTTVFPVTPTTQPTAARSTPSKTALQPTLTSPQNIPVSAQPQLTTPCTSPKTALLWQPKEPKTVETTMMTMAITATAAEAATAEVNIPSLLQDFKSWMETETTKHQDQSVLLQSLLAKNTLLESKLEAYTTRWNDEVKKQEAHRLIPTVAHSCESDLASLKERTLTQDLKISQLEAQIESRIRHSLEQDLAVVRNELQEERVDNLTKDLEIKRAEALEAMAKAREEMRDARQMVAEAREERAHAMERAARAEADNQMLLRVINELQGTGWGFSGQAQAQGLQGQDADIHHTGPLSSSLHPRPRVDQLHYPLTTTSAGSSTFMRFGTSMRQSYSSSSTESLASAGAQGAAATDPSIHRMEVISVKLENDYITRLNAVIPNPDLDPDMTEDDEGRTDTDHDATDEE
ncbi:hypothetical protein BGZ91_010560 [Linnemannia elongata]|nr:hypothetical protein BGZ91_010560 [Linnemannia elongata]